MKYSDIKICVDAGHGSNTAGKRTVPFNRDIDINNDKIIDVKKGESYREHYANVMVADFFTNLLSKKGFSVFKTGWNNKNSKDDTDISIEDRQKAIRNAKCDYVISIHFNASASDMKKFDNAEGVSVYVRTEKEKRNDSDKLAQVILNELIKGTKQKNRGIGNGKFGMCNAVGMKVKAAIIVELAFMTNEREAQELMANEKFCNECATELYNGFLKYLGEDIIDKPTFDNKEWIKRLQASVNLYHFSNKSFKKLKIDGVAGKLTLSALPTIRQNDVASIVGLLQEKLNALGFNCGDVDCDFGGKTAQALIDFQKKNGLIADGIIGQKTWPMLVK